MVKKFADKSTTVLLLFFAFSVVCGASILTATSDRVISVAISALAYALVMFLICYIPESGYRFLSTAGYVLVVTLLVWNASSVSGTEFPGYAGISGTLIIRTVTMLPLTFGLIAKQIDKYPLQDGKNMLIISLMAIAPAYLVITQASMTFGVLALITFSLLMFVMLKDKIVVRKFTAYLIPVCLLALLVMFFFPAGDYSQSLIELTLTRGESDPTGRGWLRCQADNVIKNAKFIGSMSPSQDGYSAISGDYTGSSISLIGGYGWLAYILLLAAYVVLFIEIFKMVKNTRQSSFARYLSLTCALYLLVQTVCAVLYTFLLPTFAIELPFFLGGRTISLLNCVCLAVICSLYLQKNTGRKKGNDIFTKAAKKETETFGLEASDDLDEEEAQEDTTSEIDYEAMIAEKEDIRVLESMRADIEKDMEYLDTLSDRFADEEGDDSGDTGDITDTDE